MTAQHTPAPWSFTNEPYDDGTPYISVFAGKRHSGDGFNICGIIRPEDARLIASAPDLLAALKLWLDYDNQEEADFSQDGPMLLYVKALDATRQSVDKATGGEA